MRQMQREGANGSLIERRWIQLSAAFGHNSRQGLVSWSDFSARTKVWGPTWFDGLELLRDGCVTCCVER